MLDLPSNAGRKTKMYMLSEHKATQLIKKAIKQSHKDKLTMLKEKKGEFYHNIDIWMNFKDQFTIFLNEYTSMLDNESINNNKSKCKSIETIVIK